MDWALDSGADDSLDKDEVTAQIPLTEFAQARLRGANCVRFQLPAILLVTFAVATGFAAPATDTVL